MTTSTRLCTYIYTYMQRIMYTYMHIYIHAYIHTQMEKEITNLKEHMTNLVDQLMYFGDVEVR